MTFDLIKFLCCDETTPQSSWNQDFIFHIFSNSVPGLHLPSISPTPSEQPLHLSNPRDQFVNGPSSPYQQPAEEDEAHLAASSENETAFAPQQTFTSVLNVFYDAETNSFHE